MLTHSLHCFQQVLCSLELEMGLHVEKLLEERVFQRSAFFPIRWVYGMNCAPPNSYVDVLTPSPSECDYLETGPL